MNYQIQLVFGPDADFFLEEWAPGGIMISQDVVGLFDAMIGGIKGRHVDEELSLYGLTRVRFDLTAMAKVGLTPSWRWRQVYWADDRSRAVTEAASRIERLLSGDLKAKEKVTLLQLMQATTRRAGLPSYIAGVVSRSSGRQESVRVYHTGIVAYDRTPHPMEFLTDVAAIVSERF